MRKKLRARAGIAVALMVVILGVPGVPTGVSANGDNVVLQWNNAMLDAVRTGTLGPPMVSRALAIVHTCIYDAWAAYDARAVGTQMGASLRQPTNQRTVKNKNKAISYAAYRGAVDLYPGSRTTVFDPLMQSLGYDPGDTSMDTTNPAGVGNTACQAVLDYRHGDGANQLGDHPDGTPGVPYSSYVAYTPVNDPMDLNASFDPATVHDASYWQPLTYTNAKGDTGTPSFLGAFWNRVTPFALSSAAEFRSPTGPAMAGSDAFVQQAQAVLELSANLTDEHKMITEYWADGPASETPPGHWNLFAQHVSRRDRHGLNDDAKMFFALNNAMFDASISAWDNKVAFNSVRPITAIRYLFQGQQVVAWGGPYQGTRTIDGSQWLPYQPSTFPTPPFAEYTSGHSTFSAAGAEVLKLFTGSDTFGHSVTLAAGSSKVEPGAVPAADVTLSWATFTQAADEAGISRLYGGIHFEPGDVDARAFGHSVGAKAWAKAKTYFKTKA